MPKDILLKVKERILEKDFLPVTGVHSISYEGSILKEEALVDHVHGLGIGDKIAFCIKVFVSNPLLMKKQYDVHVEKHEEGYNVDVFKTK
ncbi:MAG: hypothetical protein ACEPOV_01595 [Hyphomicrobiales bacterium]